MKINNFNFLFRMLHLSKSITIISVVVVRLFNYTTFSKKHIYGFGCSSPHLYIHGFVLQPLFWYLLFPSLQISFFFCFTPFISPSFSSFFRHFLFLWISSSHLLWFLLCLYFFLFFFPGCIGFKMGDLDRWVLSFLTCIDL